jgi:hypothetical protein
MISSYPRREEYSCRDVQDDIRGTTVQRVRLLCYGTSACYDVTLNISSTTMMDITVLCAGDDEVGVSSCQQMRVHIDSGATAGNVSLSCFRETSWECLYVDVKGEDVSIDATFLEHSDDVRLLIPKEEQLQLICHSSEVTHFLRYDTDADLSRSALKELAKREYAAVDFPCDRYRRGL